MKILITGVAGLMGSRMADWIIENTPHKVVGIDNLSGGYKNNIHKKVKFYHFDLATDKSVSGTTYSSKEGQVNLKLIFKKERPDIVYHFAAYAAECLSPFIRRYNYSNNIVATSNIVNECINFDIKRLVFTSSMAVYGENEPPFAEEYTPAPKDCYGIAKYACEQDIQVAGEQHGLDWCIIRPHNVYGRKQNIWDKYRNVLGIWMYKKLNKQPLLVYGDGEQKRAFSYIDDCLKPLWRAGTKPWCSKEIINLGGTKEVSINDACDTLIKIFGGSQMIEHCEPRYEVKNAWSTFDKSVELLKYEDKTSLSQGLEDMWEWALQQDKRKRKEWKSFEVEAGLYDYWRPDE
jgi:UDP-glucose 4-epimerase